MGTEDCDPMVDEVYEFSAPRFFDFINGETDEDVQEAELWFETSLSYAPSPFMPKIREGRSVTIESLCDFSDAEPMKKAEGSSDNEIASTVTEVSNEDKTCQHEEERRITIVNEIAAVKPCDDNRTQEKECGSEIQTGKMLEKSSALQGDEICTPEPQVISKKAEQLLTASKKNQTARKIASLLRDTSARKPTDKSCVTHAKDAKPLCVRSAMTARALSTRSAITASKTVAATDFARENQAIKRQKLEQGKARQILNIKPQNLAHNKSRLGLTGGATSSTSKSCKEERKMYVREASVPFISTAEMVRKFQYGTRDMELPQRNSSVVHEDATSVSQRRPKLTLTRPKEPEFETSHRVRSIKVKSSAELEEELMANIPKFKARPVNKKILEAPTLPALPRSTPQLPEFQEFNLKTMERANQNADSSSNTSTEASHQQSQWNPHKLTEPKTPRLETLLRARPSKAKTTEELEQEELEKIPRFKARPLNKKIFESKGDMGLFRIPKGHVTKPQEFHFATDERIPPTKSVTDLFDKLSLNSDSTRHDHQIPRVTTPNPFHLNTEERGAEKERKFTVEVMQKQLEEERARIPKATPYPYTTDYPVVPPKPEPKHCTKPEPFQLESLVRHEEEMQREMEERRRLEKEEAQRRLFKAQPILKEDPLPVPEKERRPLTQVEEFELHVDHRAVDRAEFDKKVKEKEMMYKRYREEYESARLMEEEKAVKQLRRTLVPHARPVPKFDNPFQPQKSSKETTKAKSPKLRVLERRQRRTSASASKMR